MTTKVFKQQMQELGEDHKNYSSKNEHYLQMFPCSHFAILVLSTNCGVKFWRSGTGVYVLLMGLLISSRTHIRRVESLSNNNNCLQSATSERKVRHDLLSVQSSDQKKIMGEE